MGRACHRAGLPRLGAHRLRHSLATDLLRSGASLPEIGQVLRHRSQLSTAVYAKVDHNALRLLARPWPGSADVDLRDGVLMVRDSKFGKSRYVPIHTTTTAALRRYALQLDWWCPAPNTSAFFVSTRGTRLDKQNLPRTFAALLDASAITTPEGQRRPRLHDLRHFRDRDPARLVSRRRRRRGSFATTVHLSWARRSEIHLLVPDRLTRAPCHAGITSGESTSAGWGRR
jgi:site-specific recombinase XerD